MTSRKSKGPAKPGPKVQQLRMLSEDPFGFIVDAVRRAKFGITDEALTVLAESAMYLEAGEPLPKPYAEFLAKRFREIVATGDPWKNSIFKRGRGQKAADQFDRQMQIARKVWALRNLKGFTLDESYARAGELFSVGPDTAENHYRKFLPLFRK